LGDNYDIFASFQKMLNRRIELLCHKLRVRRTGQPEWVASDGTIDEKARKSFFRSLRARTRGGFNAKEFGTLLADVDRDIDKLSKLTSGPIQLEPFKIQARNQLQYAYWEEIRDQAQRISDQLSASFLPCSCTHPHQANLRLDIRESRGAEEAASKFAFLLTYEKCSHLESLPPWNWRYIEIKCLQLASKTNMVTPHQNRSSSGSNAHSVPSISLSPPPRPLMLRSLSPDSPGTIINLCRELMTTPGRDCRLGVVEDEAWQHHIYSVTGPATKAQNCETFSLHDTIQSAKNIAHRLKCTLALTLAYSVLQLHDTPWLPRAWNTEHIFFSNDRIGDAHVYVSQTFTSAPRIDMAVDHRGLIPNRTIFTLGVALLELSYGSSILSFVEPTEQSENGNVHSMTEALVASRLARELNKIESENFARAVLSCVTWTFNTSKVDLADFELRMAFYQNVVVPLQEDYQYVTGKKKR
jgi:hypothetical protein